MQTQSNTDISILVVEDEDQMRRMIAMALEQSGYTCLAASSAEEALDILKTMDVDVVITDIAMPRMNGIALTEKIQAAHGPDVMMITGYVKNFTYGEAIAKGASDFIQKPFELGELIIRLKRVLKERSMRAELKERLRQLMTVLEGVIHALSLSIDARDPYTAGHQRRVAELAVKIAKKMGLPEDQVTGIRMAGVIHDFGKIAVPAEILSRPSELSDLEFNLIQTHPQVGYNILKGIDFPWPIAETIYQHHERMDGSGYPRGLSGDDIILEAKIMAVADVVEAIVSHRPYRPALDIDAAVKEISTNKDTFYDPVVATACLEIISRTDFKFEEE